MSLKVFVTGATGFLGKHLIPELEFCHSVRCLIRKPFAPPPLVRVKNVEYYYGDLADMASMEGAFDGIDVVIHMGAECSSKEPKTFYQTNVIGTQNIVDLCKKYSIKKLIYLSSVVVVFGEECNGDPYCQTKKEAERIVLNAGLSSIILRPTSIYASGDRMTLPVRIVRYFPLILLPDFLFQRRFQQPVFTVDVVSSIVTAVKTDRLKKNKPYFVAGPNTETLKEFLDKNTVFPFPPLKIKFPDLFCRALVALGFPLNPGHLSPQKKTYTFDLNPAREDFGFDPVDLVEAVRK